MIWFLLVPVAWYFALREHFSTCRTDDVFPCWPPGFIEWTLFIILFVAGTCIVGMICGGIARFVGSILSKGSIWTWEKRGEWSLVALRDREGTSGRVAGSLFLFSAQIDGSIYYQYYYKGKDGALVPDRLRIDDNVKIFEEDRADATLKSFCHVCPDIYYLWGIMDDGAWRYEFRVPKGTVRLGFSV